MSGLRVLITNNALAERKGSELYVKDVAEALLKLGHTPIVYSTELGAIAAEIRSATVPVVADLNSISTPPDIIHGHHHLETMTALLHFPGVPAVYFCHGWTPWEECPPVFSRITRYVAVDLTCRDRLLFEHGIPEDRVTTLSNFVNIRLFPPRAALPQKPARALVFSNSASSQNYLPLIQEACAKAGLSVDCIGSGVNNVCDRPGEAISRYDIVFAKARAALEAMAVGAAVILCDEAGLGPMVTTQNLDRLRTINFGIRALRNPITIEALLKEMACYDADEAARVSKKVRETAGIDLAVQQILSIYRDAISGFRSRPAPLDVSDELRQASAYLRWISPHIKHIKREVFDLNRAIFDLNRAIIEQSIKCSPGPSAEEFQQMAARLEATQAEIGRIKNTLGWRLLSGYGIIKHRYFLPAYGAIRRSGRPRDGSD